MAFNTRFVRMLVTASVIGLGFSAAAEEAVVRVWTGLGGDGNASTAANWQDEISPQDGDQVKILHTANDKAITWTKGDQISVLYKDGAYKTSTYTLEGEGGSSFGKFSGGAELGQDKVISALYSCSTIFNQYYFSFNVPKEQEYDEDGIANGVLPMFASGTVSEGLNFT